MSKRYSFRYPFDAATTMEPWRKELGGVGVFDQVVRTLQERDRAIEDHLSLGVGQGILARASVTTVQTGIVGLTDLTDLSATFTVPANRLIKVSALVSFTQTNAAAGQRATVYMILRDQDDQFIGTANSHVMTEVLGQQDAMVPMLNWRTPVAGTYTYRLQAQRSFPAGAPNINTLVDSTRPATLLVEDVGPAN